ncbi:YbfB/YjiJ family MFS transporter [Helicobacter baculiformis]|uniref:OMP447 n=1 Tax=Helicobacter baculiformis TaxID=427351 RepID=A0A1M4NGQ5_9HELI|nr:YbfB/YjiJ family MFS transporter [Helicobacter baculiformis]SFZ71387.1 OMP447 [Helicobacter baculiformis]
MRARIFVCFLATFVANGLARFGYVVLIPLLILSGKLSQTQSIQLGIAVMVGYIFGSATLNFLQKYISLEGIAKISFLVVALSFFACCFNALPFAWAWVWRFLAGIASACLMVLSAPLCLSFVRERSRSLVNGLIFSGIGIGVVFSGFILPHFAHAIDWAWIFLGVISLLAFLIACTSLKTLYPPRKTIEEEKAFKIHYFFALLLISVVLNAIGYLPHTLFWVDYLVRFLHFSNASAGTSWAFFGFGAALGTILSASLAQWLGLKNASSIVLLLKTLSCVIAAFSTHLFWLDLSIFLMGFGTTGNLTLTSTMAFHIMGKAHFVQASSVVTMSFGIFQALFSFIFTLALGHLSFYAMFLLCGTALLISYLVLLPIPRTSFQNT